MEKIKVLMIDDNEKLVDMIKEYFKDKNNIEVVLTAKDGLEGINIVESNVDKYDIILLDLIMPNKDGIYVLEEMKKRGINKPIIVETSYNSSEVIK